MLVASGSTRSFCFAAGALVLLFGLIQVLKSIPPSQGHVLSLDSLRGGSSQSENGSGNTNRPVRIKKVTALVGEVNYLYEGALKTHERHNSLHGYEMHVLRERIIDSFQAKPSYLLSLLAEEFAKPVEERNDWLVWFDPDTIILNPRVPLEAFLPPAEETETDLIVSHDDQGLLNSGVMFLRVAPWSFKFLVQVLTVPAVEDQRGSAISKDEPAFEDILDREEFRGRTVYQPRNWFNAVHSNGTFKGQAGDLLVHCEDINAEKWMAMDMYLGNVTTVGNAWEKDYFDTAYRFMLEDFWGRIGQARALLKEGHKREATEAGLKKAADQLRFAMDHYTDEFDVMISVLLGMKKALKERPSSE